MKAGVDVERRGGDVLRVVREQVGGRSADIVGVDMAVQRRALLESRLLEVQGEWQQQDAVMHLIARRLIDRTTLLGELLTRSRDFH